MNAPVRLLATAVAAVLALAGCSGTGTAKTYQFDGSTKIGSLIPVHDRKPAEDVSGALLSGGGTYRLAAQKGKVVLINFWASWCTPCRVESPQLDNVYRALKNKGVTIVGVDTKDFPRSKPQSFVADNQISFPVVYDEKGEIALALGNIPANGLPFSVLVDKDGRVAAVYIGRPLTPKDITPVLDTLRGET